MLVASEGEQDGFAGLQIDLRFSKRREAETEALGVTGLLVFSSCLTAAFALSRAAISPESERARFSSAAASWLNRLESCDEMSVFLNGSAIRMTDERGRHVVDDSFYVMFNAHSEPVEFVLPESKWGEQWTIALDTNDVPEHLAVDTVGRQLARGRAPPRRRLVAHPAPPLADDRT